MTNPQKEKRVLEQFMKELTEEFPGCSVDKRQGFDQADCPFIEFQFRDLKVCFNIIQWAREKSRNGFGIGISPIEQSIHLHDMWKDGDTFTNTYLLEPHLGTQWLGYYHVNPGTCSVFEWISILKKYFAK